MSSQLTFHSSVELPFHPEGDFDHGDVWHTSGDVFLVNTSAGTVEVINGTSLSHKATISGCPEASGVLVAQEDALVFAAARGTGDCS